VLESPYMASLFWQEWVSVAQIEKFDFERSLRSIANPAWLKQRNGLASSQLREQTSKYESCPLCGSQSSGD